MSLLFRFFALFVILGSMIGGFLLEGGNLSAIIHPVEVLIILGMAIGAWIASIDMKTFKKSIF